MLLIIILSKKIISQLVIMDQEQLYITTILKMSNIESVINNLKSHQTFLNCNYIIKINKVLPHNVEYMRMWLMCEVEIGNFSCCVCIRKNKNSFSKSVHFSINSFLN